MRNATMTPSSSIDRTVDRGSSARWQVSGRETLLPLRHRFRVDPVAPGERPQALLTMLYRSTDRLRRCGAPVQNLAHSASFHSRDKTAPSNPGIKHLASYYSNDSIDRCSAPSSENIATFKEWLLAELDRMAEDRVSRVVDISGGDRVLQELLQDLHLGGFCDSFGIKFVSVCMIGPDTEDFRHISEAAEAGDLQPDRMMLVMNEGVVRQGQNPIGTFEGVAANPEFESLMKAGAKSLYMRRLPCMDILRDQKADVFAVAAGRPNASGNRPRATITHMASKWLGLRGRARPRRNRRVAAMNLQEAISELDRAAEQERIEPDSTLGVWVKAQRTVLMAFYQQRGPQGVNADPDRQRAGSSGSAGQGGPGNHPPARSAAERPGNQNRCEPHEGRRREAEGVLVIRERRWNRRDRNISWFCAAAFALVLVIGGYTGERCRIATLRRHCASAMTRRCRTRRGGGSASST